MKLEVLIATTDGIPPKCLNTKAVSSEALDLLIINQARSEDEAGSAPLPPLPKNARQITLAGKGLSKSRNAAIQHSIHEILLISDNDVLFVPGFEKLILDAFRRFPEADIITFQAQDPNGFPLKNYPSREQFLSYKQLLRVSSIEIALRSNRIRDLRFDENYGLGAQFPAAEEIIYLFDAKNAGLKILFMPITICIHPAEHSGIDFSKPLFFHAKGAAFHRLFGSRALIAGAIFVAKKWKENRSQVSFWKALRDLYRGLWAAKKLKAMKS